ncbi:autotransporter outer membrane beta-barrel domain-containing protein, partial [Ochrobactrum sp. GPK 3]
SDSDGSGEDVDGVFRTRYFWGRVEGRYTFLEPKGSATGGTAGAHDWTLQAGLDGQFADTANGEVFGSIWGDYTRSQVRSWSRFGDGRATVNAYGVGAGVSWYGDNGFYLDGQGKVAWYKSDFESDLVTQALASDVSSFGYALSLEGGKRFELDDRWSVTPQAQLIWSSLSTDSFHDVFRSYVESPDNNSLTARIGLAANNASSWTEADGTTTRLEIGGVANIYQDL